MHGTGPRCIGLHRFQAAAIFLPNFLPKQAASTRPTVARTEPLLIAPLYRRVERLAAGLIGNALHQSVTYSPATTVRIIIEISVC